MLHFLAFSIAVLLGHLLGKLNKWSAKRSKKMGQPKGFSDPSDDMRTHCVPKETALAKVEKSEEC